jgi:hypothetical protein
MGCNCKNKSFINPDGNVNENLNKELKPHSWVRVISTLVKIFLYTLIVFVVLPLILLYFVFVLFRVIILNKKFDGKNLINRLIKIGKFLNSKIKSKENKDDEFDISEFNEEDLILTEVDDFEEKQTINVQRNY